MLVCPAPVAEADSTVFPSSQLRVTSSLLRGERASRQDVALPQDNSTTSGNRAFLLASKNNCRQLPRDHLAGAKARGRNFISDRSAQSQSCRLLPSHPAGAAGYRELSYVHTCYQSGTPARGRSDCDRRAFAGGCYGSRFAQSLRPWSLLPRVTHTRLSPHTISAQRRAYWPEVRSYRVGQVLYGRVARLELK